METDVLPFLSTQKRQGGGAGGGEVKGILQGTFDLAQSFAGLGCMLGNQQQDIVGTSRLNISFGTQSLFGPQ